MKKNIIYTLVWTLSVVMTGCDSWLDIAPKGKVILTTAEEYGQLFDNSGYVYYNLSDIEYLDDATWINAQTIVDNWNSPTLSVSNATYRTDYDRAEYAYGNSGNGTTFFQSMFQRITKIANTILYNRDQIEGTSSEVAILMAQAKAYRAFAYFALVNVYAKPFNPETAATDGGVPLRTDPLLENQPEKPKATVAEVYELMLRDLDEAIADLPETAKTKFRFNKAAGYALKAKIHLFMQDYDACIDAAEEAYKLNHKVCNFTTRIDTVLHKPDPFIYATEDENLLFATDQYAYTTVLLHPGLIRLYREGLTAYGQEGIVKDTRIGLYRQPNSSVKDYQYILQFNPTNTEYAVNSIGLRTTEVMLMLAECYARKGMNGKACEYLEPYLTSRYFHYEHAKFRLPEKREDAVRFILDERRKELVMGYNRFFDLRRLNLEIEYHIIPERTIPLDIEATPNLPQATYRLPANSPLYVLPFPTKVIANDPRLTSNYINE